MTSNTAYFADAPVIITVSGLTWPSGSPFYIVNLEVKDSSGNIVGKFRADTGHQSSLSFDISSALRTMWANEEFATDVAAAAAAARKDTNSSYYRTRTGSDGTVKWWWQEERPSKNYTVKVYTEQLSDGKIVTAQIGSSISSRSVIGGLTEWERYQASGNAANWNVNGLAKANARYGNASTKPKESPEHVGINSITSNVRLQTDTSTQGKPMKTYSYFYSSDAATVDDDTSSAHAPVVLRDSQEYVDFLFLNRRGAVETCSGLTKEAMDISVETKQYGRVERPTFKPSRSVMALGSDGRRSWNMSSGYVTREWAEWWTTEFLGGKRNRWWMRWKGPGMTAATFVPVIVEPAKKSTAIYDRTKQNMPHVDFTVTLALEG